MSRPKIGIVGWKQGEQSFGVSKSYLHLLNFYGNVRILTPRSDIDEDLDLVVMPGGKDTLPSSYGQVPGYFNSDPDQFKEHFAKVNLPQYIDAKIPIFGVCLGFQMLITHFGGTLTQNINMEAHGYSNENSKEGRGEIVNKLEFTPKYSLLETKIMKTYGDKGKIKCCSLHHQGAMMPDKDNQGNLPDCLEPIAYTTDGVIEAIIHEELPIAGVQFHPK